MKNLSSFISGLVFGIGLLLAGMANPAKVLGFLDLAGVWDPSLALVMGGAIAVGLIAFTLAKRRSYSLLQVRMQLPNSRVIDQPLVVGALLFGIGWGIAGVCPGPAIVAMGAGVPQALIFVAAMMTGMLAFELRKSHIQRKRATHA
ncbi:YeeE/YedE family protein [Pokkaliibacter sp. MBI-7]|uniref:YeeE/YedE family protein n=1 Tax=Pokkaliibacter sp. MBI-7 TaxID=3040600 RepID=UPI00244A321C|nr:YeeE/YedE family protein [Pokkaliibacter sp. MBI-7]MDH2431487.1 YeeE/YedE family protein [Pokkaliibacter sp. MBI-7]